MPVEYATIWFTLSIVGLAWYALVLSLGLLGCLAARRRYRSRPRCPVAAAPPGSVPGVSILRPLKGLDENLYENLESTFKQDYPNYEIILSVADDEDEALPVVRELIAKYPNVQAHVIIGDEVVGVNPKVNNLIRPYRRAANDILWVLDSNVAADPGTLARSVDILVNPQPSATLPNRKPIALVHHVPFAVSNSSMLGSRLEEAFLNTNHAKMYVAINTVAVDSCVVGKSNLYRRSDIERINGKLKPGNNDLDECGLHVFGRFLPEDNMIASAIWHELGLRHDLSCDVARNGVGNMTVLDYVWRRVRWIRVRKHMALFATLLEPFTESVVLSVIAVVCIRQQVYFPAWVVGLLHFMLWLSLDLDVYASLALHPLPASAAPSFLIAWMGREILAFPIWLLAIVGSEVHWRGRTYKVLRHGEVQGAVARGPSDSWRWPWPRTTDQHEHLMTYE